MQIYSLSRSPPGERTKLYIISNFNWVRIFIAMKASSFKIMAPQCWNLMTVGRHRELLLIFGTMAHGNNKQTLYCDPYQKSQLFNASECFFLCDMICAPFIPLCRKGQRWSRQVLIHALDASAPIHLVRAHPAGQPRNTMRVRARLMSLSRRRRALFCQIRDVGKYLHAAQSTPYSQPSCETHAGVAWFIVCSSFALNHSKKGDGAQWAIV